MDDDDSPLPATSNATSSPDQDRQPASQSPATTKCTKDFLDALFGMLQANPPTTSQTGVCVSTLAGACTGATMIGKSCQNCYTTSNPLCGGGVTYHVDCSNIMDGYGALSLCQESAFYCSHQSSSSSNSYHSSSSSNNYYHSSSNSYQHSNNNNDDIAADLIGWIFAVFWALAIFVCRASSNSIHHQQQRRQRVPQTDDLELTHIPAQRQQGGARIVIIRRACPTQQLVDQNPTFEFFNPVLQQDRVQVDELKTFVQNNNWPGI